MRRGAHREKRYRAALRVASPVAASSFSFQRGVVLTARAQRLVEQSVLSDSLAATCFFGVAGEAGILACALVSAAIRARRFRFELCKRVGISLTLSA